jgi:hypothetical protein
MFYTTSEASDMESRRWQSPWTHSIGREDRARRRPRRCDRTRLPVPLVSPEPVSRTCWLASYALLAAVSRLGGRQAQRREGQKWIMPLRVLESHRALELLVPSLVLAEYDRNRLRSEVVVTTSVLDRLRQEFRLHGAAARVTPSMPGK